MVMPPTRRFIGGFVRAWFERQIAMGRVQVYPPSYNGSPHGPQDVIEVEGEVIEVVEVVATSDIPPQLEK
jgi:hypothetical protein